VTTDLLHTKYTLHYHYFKRKNWLLFYFYTIRYSIFTIFTWAQKLTRWPP